MTDDGRTVLMCTHLLLEAEGLADQVVVMEHGTSLVWGAPDDLARQYWPSPTVRIGSTDGTLCRPHRGRRCLSVESSTTGPPRTPQPSWRPSRSTAPSGPRPRHPPRGAGVPVAAVVPFDPTLEDLYFAVRRTRASGRPTAPTARRHCGEVDRTVRPARRSAVADLAAEESRWPDLRSPPRAWTGREFSSPAPI